MKFYKIDNFKYEFCGVMDAKEFFNLRKKYLTITTIVWICYDVEIDPYYINATYEFKFPVLIFLN